MSALQLLTKDPSGSYTARRAEGSNKMRVQPSKEILFNYQRGGTSWQAIDSATVRELLDMVILTSKPFTERQALMDLHYWVDRQDVKPYRYYAKRWQWGNRKTYNLFVEAGIYGVDRAEDEGSREVADGEQVGSKKVAEQPKEETKTPVKVADGEQVGSKKVADGEQYIHPTSTSTSKELIPTESCSELDKQAPEPPPQAPSDDCSLREGSEVFIHLPLVGGAEYPITHADVTHYEELFPAVDVAQALRNMRGWCEAKPNRRKTVRGIKSFVVTWLTKDQDGGKNLRHTERSATPQSSQQGIGTYTVFPAKMLPAQDAGILAAQRGQTATYSSTWPRYKGPDGKLHFRHPDHHTKPIPDGFIPWAKEVAV
jgi:hypothetical protein